MLNIHPTPKVSTVTIPVNAPTSSAAVRAIRETLAKAGRTVETVKVISIEDARPFSEVAIDFPGSTECFVIRVEYSRTTPKESI